MLCVFGLTCLRSEHEILTGPFEEIRMLLDDLGQRPRQPQQAAVHQTSQQSVTAEIHQDRKDQTQCCHQTERRLANQTLEGLHETGCGSSSMYPAPRTVAISGGENCRSIFARKARI